MALFDRSPRSATVRAIGRVRALSVDKRTLLYRVHDDPSLAYRILQQMSRRIRAIDSELAELKEMANQGGALRAWPAAHPRPLPPAAGILKFFTRGLAGWKRTAATRGKIEAAAGQRRRGDRRKLERRQG
jgi:CRP-like cAMP-binding protein